MTASGFKHSEFQDYSAQVRSLGEQMIAKGEQVLKGINNLTTEGLQGQAAGASDQMAAEINRVTNTTNEVLNDLDRKGQQYGDAMTGNDNRFAGAIY